MRLAESMHLIGSGLRTRRCYRCLPVCYGGRSGRDHAGPCCRLPYVIFSLPWRFGPSLSHYCTYPVLPAAFDREAEATLSTAAALLLMPYGNLTCMEPVDSSCYLLTYLTDLFFLSHRPGLTLPFFSIRFFSTFFLFLVLSSSLSLPYSSLSLSLSLPHSSWSWLDLHPGLLTPFHAISARAVPCILAASARHPTTLLSIVIAVHCLMQSSGAHTISHRSSSSA